MLQSITGWLIDAFHGLQTFLIHFFKLNDSDFCVDNLFSNQYAAFMKTKYCYRAILKCARVDGLSHAVWIMGLIDFLLSSTETEASKSKRTRTFVLGSQAYHIEIGRSTCFMVHCPDGNKKYGAHGLPMLPQSWAMTPWRHLGHLEENRILSVDKISQMTNKVKVPSSHLDDRQQEHVWGARQEFVDDRMPQSEAGICSPPPWCAESESEGQK